MVSSTGEARDVYRPPSTRQRLNELFVAREPARLLGSFPQLVRTARGDNRAMMLAPGFSANDISLLPLKRFLKSRGHNTFGWGLGTNRGDVQGMIEPVKKRVRQLAESSGRPVNLVGWSLGGVFVREVARDLPEIVERVATFGTPLFGPRATAASSAFGDVAIEEIERMIDERSLIPITVPVLAVHTRRDGVVDWRSCIDDHTPGVRNVELTSSHIGLGLDPELWKLLADWFAAGR